MKITMSLATILFSASAFAAANVEVIELKGIVSVSQLKCETTFLPEQTMTVLELPHFDPADGSEPLEVKHTKATMLGCDAAVLGKIVKDSQSHFGHILDAPMKITKETSESFVNGFKQCVAR